MKHYVSFPSSLEAQGNYCYIMTKRLKLSSLFFRTYLCATNIWRELQGNETDTKIFFHSISPNSAHSAFSRWKGIPVPV
jgi:hypothetical protein